MAGTKNVSAAKIPKEFMKPPSVLHSKGAGGGGSGGSGGGSGGGAAPRAESDGVIDYPRAHEGLFTGPMMDARDQAITDRNQARHATAQGEISARTQAGIDAFGKAYQETGNVRGALAKVFHPDAEGHVHFSDPETFKAILQMGQVVGSTQQTGQPQVMSLQGKNGTYDVLVSPDGKTRPLTAPRGQSAGAGFTLSQGQTRYDAEGREIAHTEPRAAAGDAEKPLKPLTSAETGQLSALGSLAFNLEKMRNTAGATGALGYGSAERAIAMHTPFSASEAQAYNQAYNEALAASNAVAGNPRLKAVAEAALSMLPKPGQANAMNVQQAIPSVQLLVRDKIAGLVRTYQESGKSTAEAKDLARAYDAGPAYMSQVREARQALQHSPASMTDEQTAVLMNELNEKRLPQDEALRTMKQGVQRGMVNPEDFRKAATAHPELAQIAPEEMVPNPRQWQPPTEAVQQIPPGTPAPQEQPPHVTGRDQGALPPGQKMPQAGGVPGPQHTNAAQARAANQQMQQSGQQGLPAMPDNFTFGPGKGPPPGAGQVSSPAPTPQGGAPVMVTPPPGVQAQPTAFTPQDPTLAADISQAAQIGPNPANAALLEQAKRAVDPNYVPGQGF